MQEPVEIVVVTGLSGAGRSSALRVLEDAGYFCIDNLPPPLARGVVTLLGGELARVGLGIDVRTGTFLDGADDAMDALRSAGHRVTVIFLECSNEVLVRRFSETRRPHPLAEAGDVLGGIRAERRRLQGMRRRADVVLDTSQLGEAELRRTVSALVLRRDRCTVRLVSFALELGMPLDADLVFDLRALSERGPSAKGGDGIAEIQALLNRAMPVYQREGRASVTIGLGSGGAGASEAMRRLEAWLTDQGYSVIVTERDALAADS